MPRPPAELKRLEDEERRRALAHRRLIWGRRMRVVLWLLLGIGFLAIIAFLVRLLGLSLG